MISCFFRDDFFAIVWFNSPDHQNKEPIINLQKGGTTGTGYDSGEFDIEHSNGSLIINSVSISHEQIFTVYKLTSATSDIVEHYVQVIPTSKCS